MKRNVLLMAGLVAAILCLGLGDVAFAEGEGFGDTNVWKGKFGQVLEIALVVLTGIFVVVAVGMLIMGLMDSKKFGFSHFAIVIIAIIVCGMGIFMVQDMAGQDANEHLQSIKANRGKGK